MTQLELIPSRKPTASKARHAAARMIAVLAVTKDWTTRNEMATYGLNPRMCRAGRQASNGRIIYGQQGYKLLRDATPQEIGACLAITVSMIDELREDYRVLASRAHGVLNGTQKVK